jgi:hypothetical protein
MQGKFNRLYSQMNFFTSLLESDGIHVVLLVVSGIIFKPGPVQNLDSRFWPGRPGQFLFLKKSKRRRFDKKKINKLQSSFWPGFAGSSRQVILSHKLFLFFLQPGPVPIPDRPAWSGFKTMILGLFMMIETIWLGRTCQSFLQL